ncbi:MAG: prolyl oligopeptidase family serine peptidase [Bacteroidota bacterium]
MLSCKQKTPSHQTSLPKENVVDNYFGMSIHDPYRYMETPGDSITLKWYQEQTKEAKKLLGGIPGRNKLLKEISEKASSKSGEVSSIEVTKNDYYFYLKRDSETRTKLLFYRKGYSGEEHLLYNPKAQGEAYSINYFSPNWDGSYVVVGLTKNDEEISIIRILEVQNKNMLPQTLDHCWPAGLGGVHWMEDDRSFTYERIPEIDKSKEGYLLNTETVLYEIGRPAEEVKVLFSKKNNPEIPFSEEDFPEVDLQDPKDDFLFGSLWGPGPYADYYYASKEQIHNSKIQWKPLFGKQHKVVTFYLQGKDIVFLTAYQAPNFKICKTSLENPDFENPETIIPEDKDLVINDFVVTAESLLFTKKRNGVETFLFEFSEGEITQMDLPAPAGHLEIESKGKNSSDFWIALEGWTTKKSRYKYEPFSGLFQKETFGSESAGDMLENVTVQEIEVTANDGEKIPLSLIYNKNTLRDGTQRVLLSGYGAYGIIYKPKLDKYLPHWLKYGGVYAVAHVRGGGEKGDSWYKGGFKSTKANTWKDFIACAEYLINEKYTTSEKLAVFSGSAGGILIGKAVTTRPELFNCAMIRVGVMNTLRTETGPNGPNNVKEYGTVKDSVEFRGLLKMDSYHSIEKGTSYPAMLLTAGLNDARVNAWEAGKFTARMQEYNTSGEPTLLLVDSEGGHGLDASMEKESIELANMLSFALWKTGHPEFQ